MRKTIWLTAAACCVVATPAWAGEELAFGPPPDWIVPFDDVAGEEFDFEFPVHVLRSDFQSRLEHDRVIHYVAVDMEFRSSQGLSAGDLSIAWRPDFDQVTVHHVLIERDGETLDVLADGQEFNILRREQNLDAATLTGVLTANMFPAGLQVGDVLRVAYSIDQANPVLAGYPESAFGPLNGIVDQSFVRLSWPRDLDLQVVASDDLPALETGRADGYRYASMTMGLREPQTPPTGAPPRYQLVRMIEASAFADWAQLSAHFLPLYEEASQIPADGPLRAALEEIRNATQDPVERTELALALVQDRVRYVALAMGTSGLVPADTATTWARRFGDCKAKTALLIGLLHELGIEAEPVLVNSVMGDALPERLPQVGAFDHVIVRAHVNGQDFYLDGTRTGDGSLAQLQVPYFSWGLPLQAEGAQLVRLVPEVLAEPQEDTIVRVDVSAGLRTQAPTQIEALFRGDSAVSINATMLGLVGQQRRQAIETYFEERFDFVEAETVDMRFDEEVNELRFTLSGVSELDWDYSSFEPSGLRVGYDADFNRPPGQLADAPYAVPHPLYERITYEVTLPDGFSQAQIDGENVDQTLAGLEYRRELGITDNLFTAMRSIRSVAPEVPAAEARAAEDGLRTLREKRVFLDIPPGYRLSQAEVSNMAEADGTDVQYLIDQGLALMSANEWQAAKSVFDRVIAIDADNFWGYANRAVAHARLGNLAEANSDIASARESDPDNPVASHAEGMIAAQRLDWDGAVAAYSAAIEAQENNTFALGQRANAYTRLGDYDAALADANALIAADPDNNYGYQGKGFVLAEAGRIDELHAHIELMRARFPDVPEVAAATTAMLALAGEDVAAAEMLDVQIAEGAAPIALVMRASQRGEDENELKLADLDRALEIDPDFVPALLLRARVLWDDYELERALADAERVIELEPASPGGYDVKIIILLDMEREAEAVRVIDQLVERFPGDPMMLRSAAGFYREVNAYDKSEATMARARELMPDDEFFATIRGQ